MESIRTKSVWSYCHKGHLTQHSAEDTCWFSVSVSSVRRQDNIKSQTGDKEATEIKRFFFYIWKWEFNAKRLNLFSDNLCFSAKRNLIRMFFFRYRYSFTIYNTDELTMHLLYNWNRITGIASMLSPGAYLTRLGYLSVQLMNEVEGNLKDIYLLAPENTFPVNVCEVVKPNNYVV